MCYDEEVTDLDAPQGGTGKGMFVNGIKRVRNTIKIDGRKFSSNSPFAIQAVDESTQVAWIDDVQADFKFDRFNSLLTDGWNVEHKFRKEILIPHEESPKAVICSNHILESSGTTRKRRQFILEFSNYYSQKIKEGTEEPILTEHGCLFFSSDWGEQEWSKFDNFMVRCLQGYLKQGLVPYQTINIVENELRQKLDPDFYLWINEVSLETGVKHETRAMYQSFREAYQNSLLDVQRAFSNQLKLWAALIGYTCQYKGSNGNTYFILNK